MIACACRHVHYHNFNDTLSSLGRRTIRIGEYAVLNLFGGTFITRCYDTHTQLNHNPNERKKKAFCLTKKEKRKEVRIGFVVGFGIIAPAHGPRLTYATAVAPQHVLKKASKK